MSPWGTQPIPRDSARPRAQNERGEMASKNYTLKPVSTPARPRQERPSDRPARESGHADSALVRAENEDDDGYDPYSDRIEPRPLFEENPWD